MCCASGLAQRSAGKKSRRKVPSSMTTIGCPGWQALCAFQRAARSAITGSCA